MIEDFDLIAETDSIEDAIAAAMEDLEDGDCVTVHDEDCAIRTSEDECTCTPDVIVVRRGEA